MSFGAAAVFAPKRFQSLKSLSTDEYQGYTHCFGSKCGRAVRDPTRQVRRRMSTPVETQRLARVLVISETGAVDRDWVESLAGRAEVRVVATVEDALAIARDEPFDLTLCAADQLLPLSQAPAAAQTQRTLESVAQGVCLLAPDGRMLWSNSKLRSYPRDIAEAIRAGAAALGERLAGDPTPGRADRQLSENIVVGKDYAFDIAVSAVCADDGRVEQYVALAWDVSRSRRLQEKINAIDAAGRELVGLDVEKLSTMDFCQRLTLIEEKIIRLSRDLLRFDHLVVRILDPQTNRLDTVLACGLSEEAKALEIFAAAEGNGISGYVAATGKSYLSSDVTKDSRYLPGLEGARSSLTVPLRLQDQVIGIFNVESDQIAAFSEDDRQFAEIFARYIALALHILKMMVMERHTLTGQLAADVDAEVAPPLNEIVRDVQTLMVDYGQDTGLGKRLKEILVEVDHVKEAIHAVTEPGPVQGIVPECGTRDPLIAGKHILVADDEDIIRETVANLLCKAGATIVMAKDGNEAIGMIRANRFDLILSDIKMPCKNGYEVFAAARSVSSSCPVILITGFGYDPNHAIVRASKEGLNGVLFKPFKVDQLLDEVRNALTPK